MRGFPFARESSAAGTWTAQVELGCSYAGEAVIDGAGDALALCEASNAEEQGTFDATRLPAGGSWSAPQVVSTHDIFNLAAASDTAGTFVVALQDNTTGAVTALTSAPGGGFGTPAAFTGYALGSLAEAANGQATLLLNSASGDFESAEPVG